jgi:hypothetical protein
VFDGPDDSNDARRGDSSKLEMKMKASCALDPKFQLRRTLIL